jgi:hypothetical protein
MEGRDAGGAYGEHGLTPGPAPVDGIRG